MSVARAFEPAEYPVIVYPELVWNCGPKTFCMKFTSDPAYRTSTGPDPVADAEAAGLLLAEVAGAEADEELELEPDELHPATATAAPSRPTAIAFREKRLAEAPWKIITGRQYQVTSNTSTTWGRTVILQMGTDAAPAEPLALA